MTKRTLTEQQKEILLQNQNVEDVAKISIYYTKEFKSYRYTFRRSWY